MTVRLAFLGLGAIGRPMAGHLARHYALTVWNRTASRAAEFAAAHGVRAAASPREAVAGAAIVITCLPTSHEVLALLDGPEGLLAGLGPDVLFLDCTSGDPENSVRIAARLAERGIAFADCPVSGGTNGAEAAAPGFYAHVAEDLATRRVCGLGPIYALLRVLPERARGELLDYAQCVDPAEGSIVTHASLGFYA